MRQEEKASGIEKDLSEVEKALEQMAEKETAVEETVENDKKKIDIVKAVEMRNRALESLGVSQKRQQNEEEENRERRTKSRRSGGDTVAYLREKNDRRNCSYKSNECKLRVKRKISLESNIRI